MPYPTLDDHLARHHAGDPALSDLIGRIAGACATISGLVRQGALAGALGSAGQINVQQEEQKALDVITNDILLEVLADCPSVAGAASEEMDSIVPSASGPGPNYLVLFDPLDGSSNIEVNVSVGTIFSVLPAPDGELGEADFLQPGNRQVAAGYAVYGPQTMLVLTLGQGVVGFTLDAGAWRLTHPDIDIPRETREFAINMSNHRHWDPAVRGYIDACLAGKTGPRGKDFNMRWVASMVADVHRVLMRGGVFLYPWDSREPDRAGKLRLMYEANPMSMLVEQAGGQATDCRRRTLDIQPNGLHERVAVGLGSAAEVDEILAAHAG